MIRKLKAAVIAASLSLYIATVSVAFADPLVDAAAAYSIGEFKKAARLYRPLAEAGNSIAQKRLGFMYAKGQGVPLDFTGSLAWYWLAADKGDAEAMHEIGRLYTWHYEHPRNMNLAVKWTRRAAANNFVPAQEAMGDFYEEGWVGAPDYVRSYMWKTIAVANVKSASIKKLYTGWLVGLTSKMTPEQIAKGQALAAQCAASNYKNCD